MTLSVEEKNRLLRSSIDIPEYVKSFYQSMENGLEQIRSSGLLDEAKALKMLSSMGDSKIGEQLYTFFIEELIKALPDSYYAKLSNNAPLTKEEQTAAILAGKRAGDISQEFLLSKKVLS